MKLAFLRRFSMLLCLAVSLAMCGTALSEGNIYAIPPQYDDVGDFCEGFAAFRVGDRETGKWGFIDTTGKIIVPPRYDYATDFSEGLAAVWVGDWETRKWGFIDIAGKEIVPPRYDYATDFSEGLAAVRVGDSLTGKWGFIDRTGNEVVPVLYDQVGIFREGRASVLKDGKLGFVDETGTVVIPLTYGSPSVHLSMVFDVMPYFSEGLAAVWVGDPQKGPYGYIDRAGNAVIPFAYNYAAPFSEGLAYVCNGVAFTDEDPAEDGEFGYINKNGEVVVPLVYDCEYSDCNGNVYEWFFANGLAQISQEGTRYMKYGMIDKMGATIVPIHYDWVEHLSDELIFVGLGNAFAGIWESCGIFDSTGKEVVALGCYDDISSFREGLARARRDGLYGFLDVTGKEVIPCVFKNAHNFSEGFAAVMTDEKWGYIAIGQ